MKLFNFSNKKTIHPRIATEAIIPTKKLIEDIDDRILSIKDNSVSEPINTKALLPKSPIGELPLAVFLNERYEFRKNEVLGKLEYKEAGDGSFKPLLEKDENTIVLRAAYEGKEIKKKDLQTMLNSEFCPTFDPFLSYLESLPNWSPGDQDYISALSETVTVKESQRPYWFSTLRKFLVATIACAINQKIVNQHVLIFSGQQSVGKTTWLEKLLPPSLSGYSYSGDINPTNKDSLVHMAECWFNYMDEMGSYAMDKADQFKELITKKEIRMRKYYCKDVENMPRRASLVGTTNRSQFLHDETGNRRFLVFETQQIENKGHLENFNIDLVYAQAYYLYRTGFQFWFSDEEVNVINKNNEEYLLRTFGMEIINSMFEVCPEDQNPDLKLSASKLIEHIQEQSPMSKKINSITLGKDLQKCGFVPRRSNGTTYYHLNHRAKTN